ncbi:AmmeMemoRadiSam system protein B [Chitinimonas lacunae]|uniref:AmmeMemoRadiSam system protein B n=1 Tax=Chitinimonas lacunae TaxID=1963018 RepID=A0ABV8MUH6_9NEIS
MPTDHTVRPPAVAGVFYPEDREVLLDTVDALLHPALTAPELSAKILVVPHATYQVCAPVAACAYRTLRGRSIERVVLLGPAHRAPLRGLALPGVTAFSTPLGEVALDAELAARALALSQVTTVPGAHTFEHSLEVQLPFLQRLLPQFTILPLAVGAALADEVADVLEQVWGGPETLIVVSSDLSHYLPYALAQRVDKQTCNTLLTLDGIISHDQACGATPLNGLVRAAQRHGLRPHLLDLRNSGDTAGEAGCVVGFAALAYTEPVAHA